MNNETVTVRQAAEMLNVTPTTIRLYLRKGVFESAKKTRGTRWQIDREEIEAVINGEIDISGVFEK